MWGPPSSPSFAFFNYIQAQNMNWAYYQPMNMSFYRTTSQPFLLPPVSPFFDDAQLLPRRPRITNNIFRQTNSRANNRSFSTRPPTSRGNKQSFQISYRIHDGFTSEEEVLIQNSLQIVRNRLTKPDILQNMYDICCTSGYDLAPGVWFRSQLEYHRNYDGPHDLLRYQIMCLRVKGEKHEFPTIHIYPFHEKTEARGKGTLDCVSCISHGTTFSIQGEFNVKLNRYHLGASDNDDSDPVFWGGVIVHEMLHNLGHDHDGEDYSSNWQINVFENCFTKNGKYSI